MNGWRNYAVTLARTPRTRCRLKKYANAANSLVNPSSAARALAAGVPNIERVDCLVKTISAQQGKQLDVVDEIVALVDAWLEKNRLAQ